MMKKGNSAIHVLNNANQIQPIVLVKQISVDQRSDIKAVEVKRNLYKILY